MDAELEALGRRAVEQIPVTILKMEVEGYWVGVCGLCGLQSGASLVEPMGDALKYPVCPGCPGRMRDGTMAWERVEPD